MANKPIRFTTLKSRVDKARQENRLRAFKYVESDRGGIRRILCKLCGTPIKDRMNDGRGLGVLASLASYTEVTLEFDDGSAHMTPLCKTCAQSSSLELLSDCYAADMAQWAEELNTEEGLPYNQVCREVIGVVRKG